MKRYETGDTTVIICTRFINDHAGLSVVFQDPKGRSETLVSMPKQLVKQKINDTVFIKYVMNYFIKD